VGFRSALNLGLHEKRRVVGKVAGYKKTQIDSRKMPTGARGEALVSTQTKKGGGRRKKARGGPRAGSALVEWKKI